MKARPRSLRRGSSAQRGMTLVEVMISAVVLGIGLLGLVNLHTAAIRGLVNDEALAVGNDVALQVAEELMTLPVGEVPNCVGAIGCRADAANMTPVLAPAAGFDCTRHVDAAAVRRSDGTVVDGSRFRVDVVASPHPDGVRQPEGRILDISVCWTSQEGAVQELRLRRFVVPGV